MGLPWKYELVYGASIIGTGHLPSSASIVNKHSEPIGPLLHLSHKLVTSSFVLEIGHDVFAFPRAKTVESIRSLRT